MVVFKVPFPKPLVRGLCDMLIPKYLDPAGAAFKDDIARGMGEFLRAALALSANAHYAVSQAIPEPAKWSDIALPDPPTWRNTEVPNLDRPAAAPESQPREIPVGLDPKKLLEPGEK